MKYDFTSILDRRGWDSLAVEPPEQSVYRKDITIKDGLRPIPMWVADMSFPVLPDIQSAIVRRTGHPTFGYFLPRDEYFDAILRWQSVRNDVTGLERRHIGYENGVLGGVVSALRVLCSQGDKVLVHSPTYVGFTSVLENNGYTAVHSPLYRDENGVWRMDYEDMDRKLREERIHTAIFCSPHNPTGRVWERWEIERAMEVYAKNNVYVISDEIWSDLILDGKHIPTQSVSDDARERTIAFYAPSKTFNLAGLIGSYHIVYNDYLRERLRKEESLCHYNEMNLLSMYALLGAYTPNGEQWVDELREVLRGSVAFAYDFIAEHFKGVTLARPQGTYLLYLDCTEYLKASGRTMDELLKAGYECGVYWQDGRTFFCDNTIRMNLALPRALVEEAFARLKKYVF